MKFFSKSTLKWIKNTVTTHINQQYCRGKKLETNPLSTYLVRVIIVPETPFKGKKSILDIGPSYYDIVRSEKIRTRDQLRNQRGKLWINDVN